MNLNHPAIYTEFLNHFLTIIQDEEQKNTATLFSGFLRATSLVETVSSLNADLTYIPLSSVMKAGLIDRNFQFMRPENADKETVRRIKSIGFFFDKDRVNGALNELGVDKTQYTQIQQLILITACQEAKNRVLSGDFNRFAGNVANIEDDDGKTQVVQIIQLLDSMAFGNIKQAITFTPGTTHLTPEAIAIIENRRDESLEMAKSNNGTDIPEDQLGKVLSPITAKLPSSLLIDIYDELIPCMVINLNVLSEAQLIKHEAKFQLLKLHCTILSLTLNDLWQVKLQWMRQGQQVIVGEHLITLPHSISSILKSIEDAVAQKHLADYVLTLHEIQEIAKNYGQDWFTWSRNKLPLFQSSPAVGEFLEKVLQITLGIADETPTILHSNAGAINEGLNYFAQTLKIFTPWNNAISETKHEDTLSPK